MRVTIGAIALALFVTVGAQALPLQTISLVPVSGEVSGGPGTVVGWGYDITNSDPNNWVLLDDSNVSGNLLAGTFGTYVDYIASNFIVIDPNSSTGTVDFAQGSAGLGEFDIDQFVPDMTISGDINVDYTVFSTDPNSPDFDPDSEVSTGTLTAPADVEVVPEPASILLVGAALLPLAFAASRRRQGRS